jgi:hypothetical protein
MRCLSGADLGIQWIDAACADTHEDLTSSWDRARKVDFHEGSAGSLNDVRFHELGTSLSNICQGDRADPR